LRAVIREDECIGCTKCIKACPVDAIIGAAQQMHTVIADECIGCKLCVAPCPVDCIDMMNISMPSAEERRQKAGQARARIHARRSRLNTTTSPQTAISTSRKAEIMSAVARVAKKKSTRL
jgi:Na+-translocating ferredoxin:NAD+ oxidoreductase subunit B